MRVRVLGSAAGGGFPQWNCGCQNCRAARSGDPFCTPRTQDSLAVSPAGDSWLLVNASPDILRQIESFPFLHPRRARDTPIGAIVLTNGDLDHVLGLFSLRESSPLVVYATDSVREGISENAMTRTLGRFEGQVRWRQLEVGSEREVPEVSAGTDQMISLEAFSVPGKLPIHLQELRTPDAGDNVGLRIRQGRKTVVYVSGAAGPGDYLASLGGADILFFDGTFWSSRELVDLGLSTMRAEQMAHWPVGGRSGSLAGLADVPVARRVFTHINNSNPLLRGDSEERREAERAGWEVAADGLEVEL